MLDSYLHWFLLHRGLDEIYFKILKCCTLVTALVVFLSPVFVDLNSLILP